MELEDIFQGNGFSVYYTLGRTESHLSPNEIIKLYRVDLLGMKNGIPRRSRSEAARLNWEQGKLGGEEYLEALSKGAKKAVVEGRRSFYIQRPTSIEIIVSESLDFLGYEHTSQWHPPDYTKIYDEFIPPDTLIEVNGDYWHCNPKVYPDGPINEMQESNVERDKQKEAWAKDNKYRFFVLWETDINKHGATHLLSQCL